jgi:hypothetical protein
VRVDRKGGHTLLSEGNWPELPPYSQVFIRLFAPVGRVLRRSAAMVRLGIGYLGVSFVAPMLALLAYTGGDLFVTGLLTVPLAVVTFAFLWLVLEVARRDDLLSRKQFVKTSGLCGIASLLLIAATTDLVVTYAAQINLGAALTDFRMFYFVYTMAIPSILYSLLVGVSFWYVAVNHNSYVRAYGERKTWFKLPKVSMSAPSREQDELKKAANG